MTPHFALFLESADIANLISSLVNASSVGSTNSAASAIVSDTVLSFGLSAGIL